MDHLEGTGEEDLPVDSNNSVHTCLVTRFQPVVLLSSVKVKDKIFSLEMTNTNSSKMTGLFLMKTSHVEYIFCYFKTSKKLGMLLFERYKYPTEFSKHEKKLARANNFSISSVKSS